MGSPFDAAMSAADAVIGATFGEPVIVTPRDKLAGKAPVPDPNRAIRTARATFTKLPAGDRLQGERTGTQFQGMSRISGAETHLWLDARQVALLGYVPRPPDLITLDRRPGRPSYAIAKSAPDDAGGLTLTLTAESAP